MASPPAITVWVCSRSKMKKKDIKQRDLPKRAGPLNLYQCDIYSSTAAWAAARRCWVSVTYKVSVKYWHLFLDSFCSFCLIFQGKNGSMANSFSFLDFIFILFYTRLLNFCLTIVNCKCFVSPEDWTSWTNTTFCLQKYKIILNSDSFFSFFVQNEFDFNKNKTKAAYLFHTFNKKRNSCIPSLLV